MGSRGVHAWQLAASFLIFGGLFSSACSIEQPVSGPVTLTSEWKTIEPPEPLRIAGKYEQKFCLQIVGTLSDVDFETGRVPVNGQLHVLDGEATDNEQTAYILKVAEQGGNIVCLYNAADTPPGPDFPPDRTIVKLRLRSVPPLQVASILWHSQDPH